MQSDLRHRHSRLCHYVDASVMLIELLLFVFEEVVVVVSWPVEIQQKNKELQMGESNL